MSDHIFSRVSDDEHDPFNIRHIRNESDNESDSTLCSELEVRNVIANNPLRTRILRIPYIPDPFDEDGDGIYPPGFMGMGGLFGFPDDDSVEYEGFEEERQYEVRSGFEDEEEDEYSDFTTPQYDDFNMHLGKLKLVPEKNHKYKIIPFFDCVYNFDAAEESAVLRAFGPPKHENLVPFKLASASNFAEWYRYFKTSYSRTSPLNQTYCTVDNRTFRSFFNDLDLLSFEINWVINAIEEAFSVTFKKCLARNLQRVYANRNLSRHLVETIVVREFAMKAKKGVIKKRHAKLYELATTGDHGPYVKFLQAHEFPEEDIYDLVSTAFVRNINDDQDLRYYDKMREKFRNWPGTPYDKLCNLVDFLREKELIKPEDTSSYDVKKILEEKPQYKKFYKKFYKKGKRGKRSKKSKEDICLRFHPEYGLVQVPIHSSKSCHFPS